jgi:GNAT superfamily N-acetyltransferase
VVAAGSAGGAGLTVSWDRLSGAYLHARNSAAMWASMAPGARVLPGMPAGLSVVEVFGQRVTRVILLEPGAADHGLIADLLGRRADGLRMVVEDCFGELEFPGRDGVLQSRLPLMVRAAGPGAAADFGAGADVVLVGDEDGLATAERVIVDGFPRPSMQPYRRGHMLPPSLLASPRWRVWLARRDGEPAAACCTYDDGASIGVYWVATMPPHRSLGLGRAVMTRALAAYPSRPASLVATAAGQPLYSSLGFEAVATALWLRAEARMGPGG